MGNKQSQSSSNPNSPKQQKNSTNASKSSTKDLKKEVLEREAKLKNIKLMTESKLTDMKLHEERLQKIVEREDPVNKDIASIEATETTNGQDKQEQKSLSTDEISDCLRFNLISETNELSVRGDKTNFVCGVNLGVKLAKEQTSRIPMDLVCVIDDSGSMAGKKAQLVRKSLKYLLKIMNENDRVCFISFDHRETILTPFLKNNSENKAQFKSAIKEIVGRGSTNIEAGMEAGLWMIKNRKEKNPVTCLFLLSDGQDDTGDVDLRVEKLISSYGIEETFIVNSYGYGSDHDAKRMMNIAEAHKGGYYYIEDLKKVSDWFVLSISGLLSAVGEDVRIKIKQKNINETNIRVTQVYGGDSLWVKQDYAKGVFEIYLPHLVIGDNKFFVFDCEFNNKDFKLTDQNRNMIIFESEIEVRAVKQEMMIRKQSVLHMEFKDEDQIKDNSDKEYYEELMVTQSRAVGGLKIKQATELISNNNDYANAKSLLEEYKESMKKKSAKMNNNNGIKHLEEDLQEAINKCQPKLFRKASFQKMEVIHCQRRNSITHQEDWNSNQLDIMDQFNNKDICLSDDSCSDGEDDSKNKYPQLSNNTNLQSKRRTSAIMPKLNRNHSGSYSDDSLDEDLDQNNIQQKNVIPQPQQIHQIHRNNSYADDD